MAPTIGAVFSTSMGSREDVTCLTSPRVGLAAVYTSGMWLLLVACAPVPGGSAAAPPEEGATALPDDVPTWAWCAEPAPLRLNELLAANVDGLADEDGDSSDWIELMPLSGPTSLAGWRLSEAATGGWPLPDAELGGPTLVFASEKDRAAAEWHADFRLDDAGGELFLLAPEGCVGDHVTRPRTYANVSQGRDATSEWMFFLEPTPGGANTTEGRAGFAETPSISPAGGALAEGAPITLSGNGTLTWTANGEPPTAEDSVYTAPIALPAGDVVPIRAVAHEEGLWPSRPATATFIGQADRFDAGVRVVAITFANADLFDPVTGIYEYGPDYERSYPYFGANFWELWERPVHVDLFGPAGEILASQDAGIQIAGGYSRAFDQRNFELIARTAYGPEAFQASIFPLESRRRFERLYLRNGGDWCGTQLVDGVVQSLFRSDSGERAASVDAQAYEPALVYLNGEFWGVYELKERLDEDWMAAHRGADPENVDFVKLGWTHDANWTVEAGDWQAFDALEALVAAEDLADPDAYAAFTAMVDVDNFIGAIVAQGWIGNTDWWGNNLRLWRPREVDGRWRWMVYDFGHGWTDPAYDHLATSVNGNWTALPVGEALRNAEFHDRFVNVHADWLNTTLRGAEAAARVRELAAEVRPVMDEQRARWCGGASMPAWESAIEYAEWFAEERAAAVEASLVRHLAPGARRELALAADPPEAGRFQLAVVEVRSGFAGTYYEDVPVTVEAVAESGWHFLGWSDGEADARRTVRLSDDTSLEARFEAD